MTVMCDVSLYINEEFKVQLEISNVLNCMGFCTPSVLQG